MATLYVNADHPDADDGRTRAEAADDPDLPFASIHAGLWVMAAGDTLQIEPAENADPTNPNDTSVYVAVIARSEHPPAADSSAGAPSRIVGHVVDGVRPKVLYWDTSEFDNWEVEGINFGYERGSGFDHDTSGFYGFNYDVKFTNCVWTGGVFWVRGFGGLLWLDECEVYHPFTGSNFFSGVGMWVFAIEGGVPPSRPATFRVTSSHFEDCDGEDAIQLSSFGVDDDVEIGVNADTGEVLGNTFVDLAQTGTAHTDAIQCFGIGGDITIVGNHFINCASPIILSDGEFPGRVFVALNVIGEGSVWAMQFQGCNDLWVLHNTCRTIWQIAVTTRQLGVTQHIRIVNNILPRFILSASDLDPTSIVSNNIVYETPGLVTAYGTQLEGLPEFGVSDRLVAGGYDTAYELANTPIDSPGIGEGRDVDDLDLTMLELGYIEQDALGRAYGAPRDVGAFQGDATPITPEARAPYVFDTLPLGTGAALDSNVTARLFPRAGEEIDASTVTPSSAYVTDSAGETLLAVVALSEIDEDGFQTLTIDMKADLDPLTDGDLFPLVAYTAHLTAAIEDTEGSAVVATSWGFTGVGPVGPAIGDGASSGGPDMDVSFAMDAVPWPVGATVGVYLAAAFPVGAAMPSGAAVDTSVVGADSSVSFSGLTEGIRYVAFATGIAVRFMVPSPVYRTVRVQ